MKLAIITGGSRGLGAALVEKYAAMGWETIELSRSGNHPFSHSCDFSDRQASSVVLNQLFLELSQKPWEQIAVINNAGMIKPVGKASEFKPADWHANIDVNFTAVVAVTSFFIQFFQNHAANKYIVNISSGAAHQPRFGWSLYCATKAAVEMFSNSVALEQQLQAHPVNSIIINPGVIDTQMQQEIRETPVELFPDRARFEGFSAEGLLSNPVDVAAEIIDIVAAEPKSGGTYSVLDKRKNNEPGR